MLSSRVRDLHASPVRAMLSVSQRPQVISFAGGLPSPESFADIELPAPPPALLQYGPSEGEPELRRAIAAELQAGGLDCPAERVLVLSGSQQGIDLAAKLFVDAGAPVAVEAPTYLAALQVFRFFGAAFSCLDPADPDRCLGAAETPRLAYVIPTFQNPTGACWSLEQRQALAEACDARGVTLFEDDPYRDLAYDSCERRPICGLVRQASWIYQGSFSKTLAPGLRLGFLAASEDLFEHLVRLKQAADLHTNRLSQWIALRYLEDPARAQRLSRLVAGYRAKRDAFASAMDRHLGGLADWETPPGGLFFWARLRGEHFWAAPDGQPAAMRLNFSHAEPARAERGLQVLGELLAEDA
jgi:DNA-binding transcriptional MocR family regulator